MVATTSSQPQPQPQPINTAIQQHNQNPLLPHSCFVWSWVALPKRDPGSPTSRHPPFTLARPFACHDLKDYGPVSLMPHGFVVVLKVRMLCVGSQRNFSDRCGLSKSVNCNNKIIYITPKSIKFVFLVVPCMRNRVQWDITMCLRISTNRIALFRLFGGKLSQRILFHPSSPFFGWSVGL